MDNIDIIEHQDREQSDLEQLIEHKVKQVIATQPSNDIVIRIEITHNGTQVTTQP